MWASWHWWWPLLWGVVCSVVDGARTSFSLNLRQMALVGVNLGLVTPLVLSACAPRALRHAWPLEVLQSVVAYVWFETWFYHCHRMFHSRHLYPVHAVHHRFLRPVGWQAFYAHPLDVAVMNWGSMLVLSWVWRLSEFHLWSSVTLGMANTILSAHSSSPWGEEGSDPRYHYVHHGNLRVNFGSGTMLWDRFYGTFLPPSVTPHVVQDSLRETLSPARCPTPAVTLVLPPTPGVKREPREASSHRGEFDRTRSES